ncbi:MAG: hypothetical protein ACRBF0_14735 [Calditrichia bacterium]
MLRKRGWTMTRRDVIRFIALIFMAVLLSNCGHSIRYNLDKPEISTATSGKPYRVLVTTLADRRAPIERFKSAREREGFTDLADYTYDTDFRGQVPQEVTKMIIEHLDHSGLFEGGVVERQFAMNGVSQEKLDRLRERKIDAVLVGKLESFYGYYDRNRARKWLYRLPFLAALGVTAANIADNPEAIEQGSYPVSEAALLSLGFSINHMESLHKRHTEGQTRMSLALVCTDNGTVLWQDTIEVSNIERTTVAGISLTGNKDNKLAISALQHAVNELVVKLEDAPFGKPIPQETEDSDMPIVQK